MILSQTVISFPTITNLLTSSRMIHGGESDDVGYSENIDTAIDVGIEDDALTTKTDSQEIVLESLRNWTIDSRIPLTHVWSLLKLLNCCKADLSYLPLCASTLLHSKRGKLKFSREIQPFQCRGSPIHCSRCTTVERNKNRTVVEASLNVDGIPWSKSSTSDFWPIFEYLKIY